MPGIFKIGQTSKDPALRAKELYCTGVPHSYVVDYEILVDNPYFLEQLVHIALHQFHEGKEWFRCDFSQAVQTIRSCYRGKVYHEQCFKEDKKRQRQITYIRPNQDKFKEEEKARIERERQQNELKEWERQEQRRRENRQKKLEEENNQIEQARQRREQQRLQIEKNRQRQEVEIIQIERKNISGKEKIDTQKISTDKKYNYLSEKNHIFFYIQQLY